MNLLLQIFLIVKNNYQVTNKVAKENVISILLEITIEIIKSLSRKTFIFVYYKYFFVNKNENFWKLFKL